MLKKLCVLSEVIKWHLLKGKLKNADLQCFNATQFIALDGHEGFEICKQRGFYITNTSAEWGQEPFLSNEQK